MGTDIVSVKRIARLLEQQGQRFKQKTFSTKEISFCDGKANPSIHYAGRFAAKEAIKKCFLSSPIGGQMGFKEIEILSAENGAPLVSPVVEYKYADLKVSISHESDYAIALAMLVV
ncbi:MAG: holo-ACP synthase [Candidatus Marinimicrobia bacterium]|nr:holo-ACP synthase [Candidatus Neomarinimicrobiota bacterium]